MTIEDRLAKLEATQREIVDFQINQCKINDNVNKSINSLANGLKSVSYALEAMSVSKLTEKVSRRRILGRKVSKV